VTIQCRGASTLVVIYFLPALAHLSNFTCGFLEFHAPVQARFQLAASGYLEFWRRGNAHISQSSMRRCRRFSYPSLVLTFCHVSYSLTCVQSQRTSLYVYAVPGLALSCFSLFQMVRVVRPWAALWAKGGRRKSANVPDQIDPEDPIRIN